MTIPNGITLRDCTVLDANTGKLLEYRHLIAQSEYEQTWGGAFGKEVGRLSHVFPESLRAQTL